MAGSIASSFAVSVAATAGALYMHVMIASGDPVDNHVLVSFIGCVCCRSLGTCQGRCQRHQQS